MKQLMEARAEPLPPEQALMLMYALATTTLLRDATITVARGEEVVEAFKVSTVQCMTEAIIRTRPKLIEEAQKFVMK